MSLLAFLDELKRTTRSIHRRTTYIDTLDDRVTCIDVCTSCSDVSAILHEIAKKCPHLQELTIPYTIGVDDASLAAIESGCPLLQRLHIGGVAGLTLTSCDLLTHGFKHLRKLHLHQDPDVFTAAVIDGIRDANPSRKVMVEWVYPRVSVCRCCPCCTGNNEPYMRDGSLMLSARPGCMRNGIERAPSAVICAGAPTPTTRSALPDDESIPGMELVD